MTTYSEAMLKSRALDLSANYRQLTMECLEGITKTQVHEYRMELLGLGNIYASLALLQEIEAWRREDG